MPPYPLDMESYEYVKGARTPSPLDIDMGGYYCIVYIYIYIYRVKEGRTLGSLVVAAVDDAVGDAPRRVARLLAVGQAHHLGVQLPQHTERGKSSVRGKL